MPSESRNLPEQERSIKARSHELFVDQSPIEFARPTKSFPEYLRETPAEPMSAATKAILWLAAVVVGALFLAAIWRVTMRRSPRPEAPGAPKAAPLEAADSQFGRGEDLVDMHLVSGKLVGELAVLDRETSRLADHLDRPLSRQPGKLE